MDSPTESDTTRTRGARHNEQSHSNSNVSSREVPIGFRCLAAALEWGITTYDALYVLLARDFDAELVTADERLHAAAAGMPIRLLGR